MSKKYVYLFKEGDATMRELLGGKGANLAEMTKLGLPVPQGFTVSTEACTKYYDDGKVIKQNANYATYSATLVKYADLICNKPCGQAKINFINELSQIPSA